MKKGEMKKQEIIKTAEALFCRNGYESTGVQEIIDTLHTSKGSFYHHFISKEALLEEICRIRVVSTAGKTEEIVHDPGSPLVRINALFSEMIPFTGEKLSFLLMLLPVFRLPEGIHLRSFYGKVLADYYVGPIASVLEEGRSEGLFSCSNCICLAEESLLLVNHLWMKICEIIIEYETAGSVTDPADLLTVIGEYRLSIERMLCAPYGSIDLIRLPELQSLTEQIHLHWKNI